MRNEPERVELLDDGSSSSEVESVLDVQQWTTNRANQEWVVQIRNESERVKLLDDGSISTALDRYSKKRSIFKVPALLKNLNDKAYEPQMVSFGPYHYGKEHLMPMEKRKLNTLLHFLKRSEKPLESYFNALVPVVQDLKDFYDALHPSWNADTCGFLKLMVLDGCFMLRILGGNLSEYWPGPVFGDMETAGFKRDMLLLENQLPMLVLAKIDQVQNGGELRQEFIQNRVAVRYFGIWPRPVGKALHVLDMYRKTLIWDVRYVSENPPTFSGQTHAFSSAIELTEAGIRLEAGETISFHKDDGVLRLPRLEVDHATESIFLNLIAFDGLHAWGFQGEVTSFIYFMRQLIQSPRDVRLLISSRILENGIGSDEAIIQLFDSLSKEVPILNPFTSKMFNDVYEPILDYRRKPQNRLRANLVQAYHESTNWSPLAYLSILAAILLFILSFLQTWYTIYPYYRPRK
ncbi:UPF0481 protein At3g47200-like isoform X1 [Rhododendron vialii]|uniref:UPF0481 protein At3g47200-like isoform X1 n=1 Tax=Rhododendron vialii TaxID=182163 RepID=UPI00265EF5CA|nr:UPF0481 protein At3g47200-like isoform X1 [Rhododendron vialii]